MKENSNKAVIVALVGNLSIATIKFVVSVFSKSAGMLAEAIHSFVDTTNQVFLLIGAKRSKKEPDEQHSFGYGKEEYFWGFLVAVLLFVMGGAYSVYEGIHKLMNPEDVTSVWWILGVLVSSIIIEGNSFIVAFKEFKTEKQEKVSWFKHLKNSTDTNIFVIIIEDFSALVGLGIVLITTVLTFLVSPMFDAIGSVLVGILLLFSAYFLSNELRKLMIGENISRSMRNDIKEAVKMYSDYVKHVRRIRSMYLGNNEFIVIISLDIEDDAHVYQLEPLVAEMKLDIKKIYPNAKYIYIETE